jgi:light-regulated signal transduction histidine kinase (bacteriophytochrome)
MPLVFSLSLVITLPERQNRRACRAASRDPRPQAPCYCNLSNVLQHWAQAMGTKVIRRRTAKASVGHQKRRSRPAKGQGSSEETDRQLRESKAALDDAQSELDSFCYSVSHDLRAPLRSIDGFSHALLNEFGQKMEPQARDYLQRILDATKRMGRLIDELLAVSRIQRAELFRENIDVAEMAKELVTRLEKSNPERKVSVVIKPPLLADADRRMTAVVLEKLFDNAWKFTSGNSSARIEFAQRENGRERIFVVRDNGVGFNMEHAGKLFKAFQRLHAQSDYPGLGMGLAVARAIIRRHGGKIWAESAPGKGATFYFTLNGSQTST